MIKKFEKFFWQKDKDITSFKIPYDYHFVSIRKEITEYLTGAELSLTQIILQFFKENLIGEVIKVKCENVKKKNKNAIYFSYLELTLMDINNNGGNNFELFDEKNKYITTAGNLLNCMKLKKMNKMITEFDPLGEEDWDD